MIKVSAYEDKSDWAVTKEVMRVVSHSIMHGRRRPL